jgi:hypothetical protein
VTKAKNRPYKPRVHDPENLVVVQDADEMDDLTFIKHMEHRHEADTGIESHHLHAMDAWVPAYRAFHERLHKIALPGQYDHIHE